VAVLSAILAGGENKNLPSGATCHVEAAFGIALQALCVQPQIAAAAASTPAHVPSTQPAKQTQFGLSNVLGHKLFLLLPRLLFFDDPNGSQSTLSEAIKLRCCFVLEGRWAELWKQAKEADQVERVTSDAEADICDIVSILVSQLGLPQQSAQEGHRVPAASPRARHRGEAARVSNRGLELD
jgi:hypothetical protein